MRPGPPLSQGLDDRPPPSEGLDSGSATEDFSSLFNLYLDFCLDKTGRRNRTTYKRWQIDELERAFSLNPYPTSVFKKTLALRLGLRDSRVQVIFDFAFIKELK